MDLARSEQVERRDTERRQSEGARRAEELWAESVRRYNARQEADYRAAWHEYELRLYRIHSGLAAERLARAERLGANGQHEKGAIHE